MSVYKVPQDVEADDKFLGPLSFRQFIFAGIVMITGYISFLMLTKGAALGIIFTAPVMLVFGFLAFPFGREQPNEVWLGAQIRFIIKPRRRIWNQDGIKDLVRVIAPKREVHHYTDGLSQNEVKSRLSALASMMDTRGWAVKNVSAAQQDMTANDRLVATTSSALPIAGGFDDVSTATDVLDETTSDVAQHFDTMIEKSEADHRQAILDKLRVAREHPEGVVNELGIHTVSPTAQTVANPQPQQPIEHQVYGGSLTPVINPTVAASTLPTNPTPSTPTYSPLNEEEFLEKVHKEKERQRNQLHASNAHLTTVGLDGSITGKAVEQKAPQQAVDEPKTPMTPTPDPAILQLATNNDLNVATLARQAEKQRENNLPSDEVVVSLR
jgi:hypothetical protein